MNTSNKNVSLRTTKIPKVRTTTEEIIPEGEFVKVLDMDLMARISTVVGKKLLFDLNARALGVRRI